MKLSIVIPTLSNRVPDSVKQFVAEREDVEIVVINGVSPVSSARRQGFEKTVGEYVWFVDDDDEIVVEAIGNDFPPTPSTRPDIVRYRAFGWMNIGTKIYRREILEKAFAEMGDVPMTRFEDGLLYATALKYAKRVEDVDREIYVYQRRDDSASHQFDPMIVREAERLAAIVPERAEELFVYIATEMCRVRARWTAIRKVLAELKCSSLYQAAKASRDPYTKKMVWAVRFPWVVFLYRAI